MMMRQYNHIFIVLYVVLATWIPLVLSGPTTIKIVDGIDKLYDTPIAGASATNNYYEPQLPYVKPKDYAGPEGLQFLSKRCFFQDIDRWNYRVCPFQNITQKRNVAQKETLLGVWDHWNDVKIDITSNHGHDNSDPTVSKKVYSSMEYVEGVACGDEKDSPLTTTTVNLQCGDEYSSVKILEVNDKEFCKFQITMFVPIPCSLLREGYDKLIS